MNTVVVLNNDQMGHGDPLLGRKILGAFLRKSVVMKEVQAIVLYNSGVKLAVKGSPVLADLAQLHEQGVDLKPCGTCLEHYDLELMVGSVSDMDDIIRTLDQADKVITL
jgi:hypothetical protein